MTQLPHSNEIGSPEPKPASAVLRWLVEVACVLLVLANMLLIFLTERSRHGNISGLIGAMWVPALLPLMVAGLIRTFGLGGASRESLGRIILVTLLLMLHLKCQQLVERRRAGSEKAHARLHEMVGSVAQQCVQPDERRRLEWTPLAG